MSSLATNREWRAPSNRNLLRFVAASLLVHAGLLTVKMSLPSDSPVAAPLQVRLAPPPRPAQAPAPAPAPAPVKLTPPPAAVPAKPLVQAQAKPAKVLPQPQVTPVLAVAPRPEVKAEPQVLARAEAKPETKPSPALASSAAPTAPIGSTQVAPAAPTEKRVDDAPPPRTKLADAGQANDLQIYGAQYGRWLARHRVYPRLAQMRGWQGQVLVHVRVARKGSVIDMVVVRSSGFDLLDQQAMEMVRQSDPLPDLPASLADREFSLDVPIVFRLEQS